MTKRQIINNFTRFGDNIHARGNSFEKCGVSIVEITINRTITMSPIYEDNLTPLIEGCRRQERSAQNQLHKILYRYVFAICYRYVGEIDATKEVVQDVFFKAFTKLKHYEGHLSFRTWIKKIAVNTCIDRHRAKARELPTTDLAEAFYVQETAQPLEELDAAYLLEFIARLPTAYRTTFLTFKYWETYGIKSLNYIVGVQRQLGKNDIFRPCVAVAFNGTSTLPFDVELEYTNRTTGGEKKYVKNVPQLTHLNRIYGAIGVHWNAFTNGQLAAETYFTTALDGDKTLTPTQIGFKIGAFYFIR